MEESREWWLDSVDNGQKPMGVFIPQGALSCVRVVLDSLDTPRLEIQDIKIYIISLSFETSSKTLESCPNRNEKAIEHMGNS